MDRIIKYVSVTYIYGSMIFPHISDTISRIYLNSFKLVWANNLNELIPLLISVILMAWFSDFVSYYWHCFIYLHQTDGDGLG